MRYEFYRDRDVAFEGFTGKNYLFREEFTSRIWATRYDFPAVKDGRVKREIVPDETPVRRARLVHQHAPRQVQGSARARGADRRLRLRVDQQDHHVRRLCAHASRHFRTRTSWRAGAPSPEELKLLEPFRGQVPDEVFGEPFVPPVSDGSGQDRSLLRKAQQLLSEAGLPSRTANGCCRTARSSGSSF